jgi:hypothetical protein
MAHGKAVVSPLSLLIRLDVLECVAAVDSTPGRWGMVVHCPQSRSVVGCTGCISKIGGEERLTYCPSELTNTHLIAQFYSVDADRPDSGMSLMATMAIDLAALANGVPNTVTVSGDAESRADSKEAALCTVTATFTITTNVETRTVTRATRLLLGERVRDNELLREYDETSRRCYSRLHGQNACIYTRAKPQVTGCVYLPCAPCQDVPMPNWAFFREATKTPLGRQTESVMLVLLEWALYRMGIRSNQVVNGGTSSPFDYVNDYAQLQLSSADTLALIGEIICYLPLCTSYRLDHVGARSIEQWYWPYRIPAELSLCASDCEDCVEVAYQTAVWLKELHNPVCPVLQQIKTVYDWYEPVPCICTIKADSGGGKEGIVYHVALLLVDADWLGSRARGDRREKRWRPPYLIETTEYADLYDEHTPLGEGPNAREQLFGKRPINDTDNTWQLKCPMATSRSDGVYHFIASLILPRHLDIGVGDLLLKDPASGNLGVSLSELYHAHTEPSAAVSASHVDAVDRRLLYLPPRQPAVKDWMRPAAVSPALLPLVPRETTLRYFAHLSRARDADEAFARGVEQCNQAGYRVQSRVLLSKRERHRAHVVCVDATLDT